MNIRLLTNENDLQKYDRWVKNHPQGNLWQSLERKQYLEALGKEVRIYVAEEQEIKASALVVIDKTSFGLSTWEIPRGPLWEDGEVGRWKIIEHIVEDAKRDQAMCIYFSPLTPPPHSPLPISPSPRHVHAEATRLIDLTKSEAEILAQMKQKGRYNIKVAEKHGVTVKESNDIEAFYKLVTQTGKRDGFTHLSKQKYQKFLEELPGSFQLLAYAESEPIAGLLGVVWNEVGIYYYGASNHVQRAKMAPYLLQCEAIKHCQNQGCHSYDLLGIAPEGASKEHPWQGISTFKEKFGGKVVNLPAEKQIILRPIVHKLLQLKRKFTH